MTKSESNRLIWKGYFQWLLLQLKFANEGWTRWVDFYDLLKELVLNNEGAEVAKEFNSATTLRSEMWREIQSDTEWVEAHGWPISKNGTGIKLTNDIKEVKEFVAGEFSRAMSVLTKVSIFKKYLHQEHLNNDFYQVLEIAERSENGSN